VFFFIHLTLFNKQPAGRQFTLKMYPYIIYKFSASLALAAALAAASACWLPLCWLPACQAYLQSKAKQPAPAQILSEAQGFLYSLNIFFVLLWRYIKEIYRP
jgi:hypothetical protein